MGRRRHTGKANARVLLGLENIKQADDESSSLFNLKEKSRASAHTAFSQKCRGVAGRGRGRQGGPSQGPAEHGSRTRQGGGGGHPESLLPWYCGRRTGFATHLLQLQLRPTAGVGVGSQAPSEQGPDGGGIHGVVERIFGRGRQQDVVLSSLSRERKKGGFR